jgi:2-keto-4-pentenoate hydratase/2-oxohepta-3-ene-1,7-dioic acid hydratase in catechol pathway
VSRWCRFVSSNGPQVGRIDGEQIKPISIDGAAVTSMRQIIEGSVDALMVVAGTALPLADVTLLEPLGWYPRNIVCVGKNYREHAAEFSASGYDSTSAPGDVVPSHPIIFTKPANCVVGHGDQVELHGALTAEVDYEAELAVVIGTGGRNISAADAMRHVFGYTIVNDVTARDLQRTHKQWFIGKGLDTFCPIGPTVVTADELDLATTIVECTVNGERRQKASTADLIFDVPTLIAAISAGMTLLAGDVIATGTPAGVGIGFNPPRFLRSGDVVSITINPIGTLTNAFA